MTATRTRRTPCATVIAIEAEIRPEARTVNHPDKDVSTDEM
jgi:hypothetical protein